MKEIVNEVLLAEEQAARIISEARGKAAQMKSLAETESGEAIKKAREDAQALIHEAVAKARAEADTMYKNAMIRVEEANHSFLKEREGKIGGLVDRIVARMQNPEHEKEL